MLEQNFIKVPMGGEISAGDLLTRCTLKNTDAYHFHNDQRSLPRAAQITACYKGEVDPKMEISQSFTHPQGIL